MLNGTVIETTTEMKHLIKTDLTIVKEWVECGTLFESEDGYFGIRAGEGLVYIGSNSFNVEINKYLDFQFVPEKNTSVIPIRIPMPDLFSSNYLVR